MVTHSNTFCKDVSLLLQASKPSIHVCSAVPLLPQLLNQAPPVAQQLRRPDFSNVPHFEHVIIEETTDPVIVVVVAVIVVAVMAGELVGAGAALVGAMVASADMHGVVDCGPDELEDVSPVNAVPQSLRAGIVTRAGTVTALNISVARVSHLEMSTLKDVAPKNMPPISVTLDTSQLEMSTLNAVAP